MTKKYYWFDMDGTIYDLYKVKDWLPRLRAEDATVYAVEGYARRGLARVMEAVKALRAEGHEAGIITWGAMNGTDDFLEATEEAKYAWAELNANELLKDGLFYCVPYGTPKHEIARRHDVNAVHVLVDDNKEVRADWRKAGRNFQTINAARGYTAELYRELAG